MQAAFTKKTQEAAAQRKEAEALRADAENFRKYQQHIPIIEEMLAKQNNGAVTPELEALKQKYREAGYNEDSIEMMTMGLNFALSHVNQTQQVQRQTDWVNSQINEAAKVDTRLTDASLTYQTDDGESFTFGELVEQQVAADPNWSKDPVAATKKAVKRIDALVGKAKIDGKQELSANAKAKARQFPANSSSPQSTSETESTGSIRDIGKQVMTEMGMKS